MSWNWLQPGWPKSLSSATWISLPYQTHGLNMEDEACPLSNENIGSIKYSDRYWSKNTEYTALFDWVLFPAFQTGYMMGVGMCLVWWPSIINSCRCFRPRKDLMILLVLVNAPWRLSLMVFDLQLRTISHVAITPNTNVTHGWIDRSFAGRATRPSFVWQFHPSYPVIFWPSPHVLPEGQLSPGFPNQWGV